VRKPAAQTSAARTSGELNVAALDLMQSAQAPTTFGELADRLGAPANDKLAATLGRQPFAASFKIFNLTKQAKPEAPAYAISALPRPEVLRHVLEYVLGRAQTKSNAAFSAAELQKRVRGASAGKVLREALQAAFASGELPSGVAALPRKGTVVFFRVADMVTGRSNPRPHSSRPPTPPPSAHSADAPRTDSTPAPKDFAPLFDRAFRELDAAGQGLNHVKLHALRQALPQFDRTTFDAELRKLRLAGRYDLNPTEGTHGRLTDEEREAGIVEAGLRLVFCQRVD